MHHSPSVDIVSHTSISYFLTVAPNLGLAKANESNTNTRAIFILAGKKPPHNVYGNPFYNHAGFLNVFSVNPAGGLDKNVQNAELDENSAIHGMVFDPEEEYLYSADMWANKIWCHKKVHHLTSPIHHPPLTCTPGHGNRPPNPHRQHLSPSPR